MKRSKTDDLNFIENTARQLLGFDDATIQKEMDKARQEWEQTIAEDKEAQPAQEELDRGFDALMMRIHNEDIQPVTEEMYEQQQEEAEHRVIRLKQFRYVGILVAAIIVLMVGSSLVATAHKSYQKKNVGLIKNENIWDDNSYIFSSGELDQVYERIQNEVQIDGLVLGYIPNGLKFNSVHIEKDTAIIEFVNNENKLYLKESKLTGNRISSSLLSDKSDTIVVYNVLIDMDIIITENQLETGEFEYIAEMSQNDVYYHLHGILDKEEFLRIIDSLKYFES
ncbi:MAG: DUF4367 domain-containing protein [Lachnospiraceae bacterium]